MVHGTSVQSVVAVSILGWHITVHSVIHCDSVIHCELRLLGLSPIWGPGIQGKLTRVWNLLGVVYPLGIQSVSWYKGGMCNYPQDSATLSSKLKNISSQVKKRLQKDETVLQVYFFWFCQQLPSFLFCPVPYILYSPSLTTCGLHAPYIWDCPLRLYNCNTQNCTYYLFRTQYISVEWMNNKWIIIT